MKYALFLPLMRILNIRNMYCWCTVHSNPCYKKLGKTPLNNKPTQHVAKGFHQRPSIDVHDTFNPVIKPTIHLILALALSNGWPIRQLNVNNTFLHGTLSEVFMQQPRGFVAEPKPNSVRRLHNAIYRLKPASQARFNDIKGFLFLLSYGILNSHCDTSLSIYHTYTVTTYFPVYVDDLLVTGNNTTFLNQFLQGLSTDFSIKDLGDLYYFLGIEILPTKSVLLLT